MAPQNPRRMRIRAWGRGAAIIALTAWACTEPPAEPVALAALLPAPPESTLKADALGIAIKRGRAILSSTSDSLPDHVGNRLSCTSCHLDDGRRTHAMPWVGVYARFPQYRSRSGKVDLLEDRINDCFERSLNGRALDVRGADMRDIVAYMAWLSRGTPVGKRTAGQGIDSLVPAAGSAERGATVYAAQCARCHGANGEGLSGLAPFGTQAKTAAPPLWGAQSFNIGAGMARLRVAAAFIAKQMPLDKPGTIPPQDAFDVAAYIGSRPRPDFARKAQDWPLGGAPPDVAYPTEFAKRSAAARP